MNENNRALTPADGAEFVGKIEDLGEDSFRASCRPVLDQESYYKEELPTVRMFQTTAECEKWIHDQAFHRGFESYRLE